jgi:hypothetical protein
MKGSFKVIFTVAWIVIYFATLAVDGGGDVDPSSSSSPSPSHCSESNSSTLTIEPVEEPTDFELTFDETWSTNNTSFQHCHWEKKPCGSQSYDIRVAYHNASLKRLQQQQFLQEMEHSIVMAMDLWSRAIQRRPNPNPQVLHLTRSLMRDCGSMFHQPFQTKILLNFGLLLCFKVKPLPASAVATVMGCFEPLLEDPVDGLPRIASVTLNSVALDMMRRGKKRFNQCEWTNVIAHEIGHALGFPEAARKRGLIDVDIDILSREIHFCGVSATREWRRLSGCRRSFPPLDKDGIHWPEEDCINLELMTPAFVSIVQDSDGKTNARSPISRLTLAALEDVGYHVNYNCADEAQHILSDQQCKCQRQKQDPLTCRPRRRGIIRLRRRLRRLRRKVVQNGIQGRDRLGNVAKRFFTIIRKGYLLKLWWWRRKYRYLKKRLARILKQMECAIPIKVYVLQNRQPQAHIRDYFNK